MLEWVSDNKDFLTICLVLCSVIAAIWAIFSARESGRDQVKAYFSCPALRLSSIGNSRQDRHGMQAIKVEARWVNVGHTPAWEAKTAVIVTYLHEIEAEPDRCRDLEGLNLKGDIEPGGVVSDSNSILLEASQFHRVSTAQAAVVVQLRVTYSDVFGRKFTYLKTGKLFPLDAASWVDGTEVQEILMPVGPQNGELPFRYQRIRALIKKCSVKQP